MQSKSKLENIPHSITKEKQKLIKRFRLDIFNGYKQYTKDNMLSGTGVVLLVMVLVLMSVLGFSLNYRVEAEMIRKYDMLQWNIVPMQITQKGLDGTI